MSRRPGMIRTSPAVVADVPRGPNPLRVAWSILRSLARVRPPRPGGTGSVNHRPLEPPLRRLAEGGSAVVGRLDGELADYLEELSRVDPDRLSRDEALAFWINLYNAGALRLAGEAQRRGEDSVLRMPGAFGRRIVAVAGERLSLDDVEHGKLRRFGDPRIHTALICGTVSCPTLRSEPYAGPGLSGQLDRQLARFLTSGGCRVEGDRGVVTLSRVFLWFGADFVRPHRMPTFRPAPRRAVLAAVAPWLEPEARRWVKAAHPKVVFQPYDWGLRCAVR